MHDDPLVLSGEFRGINSGKDLTYLTNAARYKLIATPWYKKPLTRQVAIDYVFLMYDWYVDKFGQGRPKATGLSKFYANYGLTKAKHYCKLFKQFKDGYNPYNDTGLLEYVKETKII